MSTITKIVSQTPDLNNPQNGITAVDLYTYHIYINGRHVSTAYGTEWEAWGAYAEWQEAIADSPDVELYQDTLVDEIPASYWKNGHVEPLRLEVA